MPVSVTMPRLGESVTEGTVTRWLKAEGDTVEADEPLLEVSTDKVDTEVPSPAAGTLLSIKVAEDETVEIGVELAVIGDPSEAGGQAGGDAGGGGAAGGDSSGGDSSGGDAGTSGGDAPASGDQPAPQTVAAQAAPDEAPPARSQQDGPQQDGSQQDGASTGGEPAPEQPNAQTPPDYAPPPVPAPATAADQPTVAPAGQAPPPQPTLPADAHGGDGTRPKGDGEGDADGGAYVTPLVRKLAAERGVDLSGIEGTGVGGRIRKSDVLAAAEAAQSAQAEQDAAQRASAGDTGTPASETREVNAPSSTPAPTAANPEAAAASPAPALQPARGRTEKISRLRAVIAARMVESLQTSAQLTTVVEVDVTRIARLRERAGADFLAREGVKLSFNPFFAVATIEALKEHPSVNASIDTDAGTITFHESVHLGVAVDTERGLLVPVVQDAGDLNLGGLARKIADLAARTRTNKVTPDELGGGTFTLTNTGSRGALFDTPIINQPQVGILGTGAVVKRPVVITDAEFGETIAVRSMVYLALTYDHRLVDGADAARFLSTVKARLEGGNFEAELGLG